jgi:hypothetical protein
MKYNFHYCILIVIAVLFSSCFIEKHFAVSGTYPVGPFIYKSEKSFDTVWSNIIDLFGEKGLAIRINDKSSGRLTGYSNQIPWTYENDSLKPNKRDKYLVVGRHYYLGQIVRPEISEGEWNISVMSTPSGGSIINVNLISPQVYSILHYGYRLKESRKICFDCKSTGEFEKMIADLIK